MKVYIVRTGTLRHDINTSFALAVKATKDNPNPEAQWYTSPTYAVLIEHPEAGWILYDLGPSAHSDTEWPEAISNGCYYVPVKGETMEEQLSLLHLMPSDIRYVILSHMHMDHIGNIKLFQNTAEFFVAKAEAEYAFTTVMGSTDPVRHGFYNRSDVLAQVKRLHYIEEELELFDGIKILLLPGHTPMVLGLILELEEQNLILVSDALCGQRSFDGWMAGTVYDTVGWRKSRERILRLTKEYDADVFFGHDPDQSKTLKRIPDYYR